MHSFNYAGKSGAVPSASLIFDASGNLYGTIIEDGSSLEGTVFELTPKAGGGWTEKVLHGFNRNGKDGEFPYCTLILDDAGNLCGTTFKGGDHCNSGAGCWTVFEIIP